MALMVMAIISLELLAAVRAVSMSFKRVETLSMLRELLFEFSVYDLDSAVTVLT